MKILIIIISIFVLLSCIVALVGAWILAKATDYEDDGI